MMDAPRIFSCSLKSTNISIFFKKEKWASFILIDKACQSSKQKGYLLPFMPSFCFRVTMLVGLLPATRRVSSGSQPLSSCSQAACRLAFPPQSVPWGTTCLLLIAMSHTAPPGYPQVVSAEPRVQTVPVSHVAHPSFSFQNLGSNKCLPVFGMDRHQRSWTY